MENSIDARLLADLLDRHCAALELYASQWTSSPEDVVQEAFVELARQKECPRQPMAWLYRVVRNRSLNAIRATNRRLHHEQIAAQRLANRLSEQLEASERESLIAALDALEATEREVVVLRVWSELAWKEIAELLDTSSSSAQRRYVAALKEMRTYLEPSCQNNLS